MEKPRNGRVKVNCLQCGKEFEVYLSKIKKGKGKFCSLSCSSTYYNAQKSPIRKTDIVRLYWRENLSTVAIANLLNVSHAAIHQYMKRHGIKRRTSNDAQKNRFIQMKHPAEKNRQSSEIILKDNLIYVKAINTGNLFVFDYEPTLLEKLKLRGWYENKNGYLFGSCKSNLIFAHHLILPKKCGLDIDHIDRNPKNNRKENLRYITHTGNLLNAKLSINNKSGHKGVYFDRRRQCWVAYIRANGKKHHLGQYKKLEDAIHKRKEYEKILIEKEMEKACQLFAFQQDMVDLIRERLARPAYKKRM